jgi:hypothetical protein
MNYWRLKEISCRAIIITLLLEELRASWLEDGQACRREITYLNNSFPGHSPGHIGLYERKHRLFFCGDHILDRITPNNTFGV